MSTAGLSPEVFQPWGEGKVSPGLLLEASLRFEEAVGMTRSLRLSQSQGSRGQLQDYHPSIQVWWLQPWAGCVVVCGKILDGEFLDVKKIQKTWRMKKMWILKKVVLGAVTDFWTPTGECPSNVKDLQSKMSEIAAKTAVNSEQTSLVSWFSLQLKDQITLARASVSLKLISRWFESFLWN